MKPRLLLGLAMLILGLILLIAGIVYTPAPGAGLAHNGTVGLSPTFLWLIVPGLALTLGGGIVVLYEAAHHSTKP